MFRENRDYSFPLLATGCSNRVLPSPEIKTLFPACGLLCHLAVATPGVACVGSSRRRSSATGRRGGDTGSNPKHEVKTMKIAATTLTPRSSGTAQQLRCWVPSALRAPAAPHLKRWALQLVSDQ